MEFNWGQKCQALGPLLTPRISRVTTPEIREPAGKRPGAVPSRALQRVTFGWGGSGASGGGALRGGAKGKEALRGSGGKPRDRAPPLGLQLGLLTTCQMHTLGPCWGPAQPPKGRVALCTCPRLQVQLLQHNVEKEEDGLHKAGDRGGVSRAPAKGESRAAASGQLWPWG